MLITWILKLYRIIVLKVEICLFLNPFKKQCLIYVIISEPNLYLLNNQTFRFENFIIKLYEH